MDPQFPFKTEKLSEDEVRLLRKRMLSTWIFGAVIGAFAGYFLFGDFGHFEGMRIPVTIFAVFFYLILGFILFVHTRNAFQTEKRIYSGRITDKKTEASRMRNSQMNEEYYIALEGNWFRVELLQFQKVHVNDQVEIFTLGKTQVFKIERRGEASLEFVHEKTQTQKQTDLYSGFSNFSEVLGENDRSVLKSALRKAFFFRTILGFFGCYLLYYILNVVLLLITYDNRSGLGYFIYIHYGIWILLICSFILLNRKTWKLISDLRGGEKEIVSEKIIDMVRSNHLKPGPNSILRGQCFGYDDPQYFYIQTRNFWIQTDENTFQKASAGQNLQIHLGKYSRVVLQATV